MLLHRLVDICQKELQDFFSLYQCMYHLFIHLYIFRTFLRYFQNVDQVPILPRTTLILFLLIINIPKFILMPVLFSSSQQTSRSNFSYRQSLSHHQIIFYLQLFIPHCKDCHPLHLSPSFIIINQHHL